MVARLQPDGAATLAVPCVPLDAASPLGVSPAIYAEQRAACVATWKELLGRGMQVEAPEPLVNHAWRNALCQNFQLINHGQLRYSTGNQYDRIYSAEGSDAAMALLDWGYEREVRRLMGPLFDFTRKGLELHQASFKINNVVRYYWQTRDASVVRELRPRWEPEAERFIRDRTGPNGLYPKEQYCGDIFTPVQSLNVNAKAWRAMRDLGALLGRAGRNRGRPALRRRGGGLPARRAPRHCASRRRTPPRRPSCPSPSTAANRCTTRFCTTASAPTGTSSSATPSAAASSRPAARRRPGFRATRNSTAASSWAWSSAGGAQFNFWTERPARQPALRHPLHPRHPAPR